MTMRSKPTGGDVSEPRGVHTASSHRDADIIGILDTVDVPIMMVGRDCTIARFNRAAADALGLTPSDIGRLPCNVRALNEVKDLETFCSQVFADAAPSRREIRNGDRWFSLRVAPYVGRDGQLEGAVLTFTNVTAFRASLGQAIYDREYTKAILNTVKEPIVVLDAELRVQTGNRAFYDMFGAAREAVQGVPLASLADEAWERSSLWPALERILSDETEFKTMEIASDFHSGRRTVLLHACRTSQTGSPTVTLVFQDVTEYQRAQEHLRRAERELRDFVDNATVGMHWVGPDGIILWANRAELEMLGYSRDEYIGRHIAEFHADPPAIEDILRRLTKGETLHEYSARLRCKDGSVRDVLINSNVLWEGGKFIHTRCFTRDITERQQAEDARALAEEELRDANRRKDEFLAMLAHELRNPLAPIRNAAQVIRLMSGGDQHLDSAYHIIERQVAHMTRLVDDLLDVSRITQGKIQLRKESLFLEEIIEAAVEQSREAIEQREHTLAVHHTHGVGIHGDRDRMVQVVANLLGNAAKFTPKGGHISVWTACEGDRAIISVRDTGVGIPQDAQAKIFDLFAQADTSLERSEGGLGIGLTLANRLVHLHGGSVEVKSEGRGKGAEFLITLPTHAQADRQGREERPVVRAAATGQLRILVVEDNADAAESFRMLLELSGHHVRVAVDGVDALRCIDEFAPDVAFIDIGLPGLDGFEVAERTRAQRGNRPVLVALSGYGRDEDKQRAKAAGFDEHMTKPVELERVNALLTNLGASRLSPDRSRLVH
jgi:PAS domain S-box-containing protein